MALTTNNRTNSELKQKRNPLSAEAVAYAYQYRR